MRLELELGKDPARAISELRRLSSELDYTILTQLPGNREDYIQIPNTNTIIARTESHNGLTNEDTVFALQEEGLYMPSPALFMPYFVNVRDASQGKLTLHTADSKLVPRDEAEELWKKLSTGCWTHLDARFESGTSFKSLSLLTNSRVIGRNITSTSYPLERCVMDDVFVDLDFNSQGLPVRKSQNQNYEQGGNIRYWHPTDGSVAWFDADSVGADLDCYWNPDYSSSALGVFSCAEGAPKNRI